MQVELVDKTGEAFALRRAARASMGRFGFRNGY